MILLSSHTFLRPFRDSVENLLEQASLCLLVTISVILTADTAPYSITGRVLLSIVVVVPSVCFAIFFIIVCYVILISPHVLPKTRPTYFISHSLIDAFPVLMNRLA
jgi:hypothetical protein